MLQIEPHRHASKCPSIRLLATEKPSFVPDFGLVREVQLRSPQPTSIRKLNTYRFMSVPSSGTLLFWPRQPKQKRREWLAASRRAA
jgi:hypothetical protein